MEDPKTVSINITSVSDKGFMLEVFDEKKKYKLWKQKSDKTTETKAFGQWKTYELGVGQTVEAGVREVDKEWEGRPYKERTIAWFNTDEYGTPNVVEKSTSARDYEAEIAELKKELEEAHATIAKYESKDGIDPESLPF